MREILISGLKKYNIDFSKEQLDKIDLYYDLIVEKNKVMNLTRITDKKEFYVKHILDSVSICNYLSFNDQKILDLGTGAGFPGIPLKIFFPEIRIIMVDSVNKKLEFINSVIDSLQLQNIKTVHGRAEDIARINEYRENFDFVLSRAVADLSVLSEYALPFVSLNGYFIAYKSWDCDQEIKKADNAIRLLSGAFPIIKDIILPNTDISRKLVIIKKISAISSKYPRKAGIPSKNPL